MAGNRFGEIFSIMTYGESHGKAMGVIIDGCPAGVDISALEMYKNMNMVSVFRYYRKEFFRTYHMENQFTGWIRNMLLVKIDKFFIKNISQFHP